MLKKLTPTRIAIGLVVLGTILNIIAYPFLPEAVAMHFDNSGNTDGTMPKALYIVFMAVLPLVILYLGKVRNKLMGYSSSIVSGVCFIGNIVMLYINIK